MKLVSWNVNGIRSWHKKEAHKWFLKSKPDIFCVQETKAEASQVPEELRNLAGYFPYFNSSKARKGYSGVGVWSKIEPKNVVSVLEKDEFDQEGRLLVAYFDKFVFINCYFPNGGQGPHRIEFKLKFYDEFFLFIESLRAKGLSVIFCGDINTAHHEIDLARPKENVNNTGFLPIERAWLDKLEAHGYIDTFRFMHPKEVKYSYWDMKTFARDRNVGWRIDYFFVSPDLKKKIKKAEILDDVFGSDHCPVLLEIDL